MGLADLAVNPLVVKCFQRVPEVRPLPSAGITPLRRYYGPIRHPSAARPVPRGRPVGGTTPPLGLPVLRSSSYAGMPSPLPRRDRRWDRVAPLKSTTSAFPMCPLGRLPHHSFRGLFGVYLRYGLPARGIAKRSFPSKASAASLPPLPLRLLLAGATVARWELHPLKNDALARRTDIQRILGQRSSASCRPARRK